MLDPRTLGNPLTTHVEIVCLLSRHKLTSFGLPQDKKGGTVRMGGQGHRELDVAAFRPHCLVCKMAKEKGKDSQVVDQVLSLTDPHFFPGHNLVSWVPGWIHPVSIQTQSIPSRNRSQSRTVVVGHCD